MKRLLMLMLALVSFEASAATKTILEVCTTDNYQTFKAIDPLDTGRYFPTTVIRNTVKACVIPVPPINPVICYPTMPDMPCVDTSKIPERALGSGSLDSTTVGLTGVYAPTAGQPDAGAFREWSNYSHMNFDDAIKFPGQKGVSHLHTYFGNTGSNYTSTADSIRTTGNSTTAGGTANRSSYWVPAMIDGNGAPLKPDHALIYYKHSPAELIPQGLKIIAGSMYRNTSVANSWERRQWFECNEVYNAHADNIPACDGRVTMGVAFPDCWNGKDLDSTDHFSHVAYSDNGTCDAAHPHKIPTLWLIVHYLTVGSDSSKWRLSSDMYAKNGLNSGYSAHGDVIFGHDENIERVWLANCINAKLDCHADLIGDGRSLTRVDK